MGDTDLVAGLQVELTSALRARDRAAVTALRTALAALANAEAPAFDPGTHPEGRGELVQHERLALSADDQRRVLAGEVERREALLAEAAGTGVVGSYVADLEAEVAVLRRHLA